MRRSQLVCVLRGHRVLLDFANVVSPEPGVMVGPVIRRCTRCGDVLPGDEPQEGDRMNPDEMPVSMSPEVAEHWFENA